MTEMYIDGYPVSLPDDFEIDYYVMNPFFTKKGEYTYDIDINLLDKYNAQIYQHINRSHSTSYNTGRRAIIVSNARVVVIGTEIILKLEDNTVKIQIVAGNSEMNYLSGGKRKIKDLDLGTLPNPTATTALETLFGHYPTYTHVYTPVYDVYYCPRPQQTYFNSIAKDTTAGCKYDDNAVFVPQPYLMYYIEKICSVLGYTVAGNTLLNTELFCKLIIVSGTKTLHFNEMVPNWDVDEFLNEIEKLFNVIFVVNQRNRTVDIMNIFDYYQSANKVYVDANHVVDSTQKSYNTKQKLELLYQNVAYKLPQTDLYQYDCLSEELMRMCRVIKVSSFEQLLARDLVSEYNQLIIYEIDNIEAQYCLSKFNYDVQDSKTQYYFKQINSLKDIVDDDTENSTSLKIVPAEIITCDISGYIYVPTDGKMRYRDRWATIPYARNRTEVIPPNTAQGMNEYVKSGIPETAVSDTIFIAIYDGIKKTFSPYKSDHFPEMEKVVFPQVITNPYRIFGMRWDGNASYTYYLTQLSDKNNTLSLNTNSGWAKRNYNRILDIDTTVEYVKKIITEKIDDAKAEFVLDNRRYYCKQLHYKINADGIAKEVEGIFYPMK